MSTNQSLSLILKDYNKINNTNIQYSLCNIIVIAFLKENNETLETLEINKEFKDELFIFISDIINTHDSNLSLLLKQYN